MYIGIDGAIRIAITVIILVFVILSLLALLMIGLREVIKLTSKKQVKEEKMMIPDKRQTTAEKAENKELKKKDDKYKEELVAVISAAISSYMEVSMKKIKIISINRSVPAGVSPWTIAGKQNRMSSRISISSRKRGGF